MKIISLIAALAASLAPVNAAYITQEFGFFGSESSVVLSNPGAPIGNKRLGTLRLIYDDSVPIVTQLSGIRDLKFDYYISGGPPGWFSSLTLVENGISAGGSFSFLYAPQQSGASLQNFTSNGLNFIPDVQRPGMTRLVHVMTPDIYGDNFLGVGSFLAVGVPDGGSSLALLGGAFSLLGLTAIRKLRSVR